MARIQNIFPLTHYMLIQTNQTMICPQENNKDIHNITSLLNTKVIIEKPNKKDKAHCNAIISKVTNIQKTTVIMMLNASNVVKTIKRTNAQGNSPSKCALCNLDHTTNFKECSTFE